MQPVYRIHPAIGVARLGDSPEEFYIGPEAPAALPVECDSNGNPVLSPYGKEQVVSKFKDEQGRIKRQAARFQVYVYDDASPEGRPLELTADVRGGGNHGKLVDIQWRVHLANKKAAWYEFHGLNGEHGYAADAPLRNASITGDDARRRLMIDAGPRYVNGTDRRRASFDRDSDCYATVFPPKGLAPREIDTLGELVTDNAGRLLVLGGHGNSGSCESGLGEPRIADYANNDGWFDDISDGPVMARLVMYSDEVKAYRYIDVEDPAWVLVGYPRYCPEILDMITLDEVVYDLAVRKFAYRTDLYGVPGTFDAPQQIDISNAGALDHWNAGPLDWNSEYRPWFYRDVWPILFRVDELKYLNNILSASNAPHDQTERGSFDPTKLSVPPVVSKVLLRERETAAAMANQAGTLFLEEIELKLHVFDDVVEQALRRHARTAVGVAKPDLPHQIRAARGIARQQSAAADSHEDHAEALKAAAAAFAKAVLPNGPKLGPDEYRAAWTGRYRDDGAAYTAARDRFRGAVLRGLEAFIAAAVARWAGSEALLSDGSTLREVVTEAVVEIAEAAMGFYRNGRLLTVAYARALAESKNDPYAHARQYLYGLLRKPGEENVFKTAGRPGTRLFRIPLMPLLAGDNPTSNELPSKFLRLLDYQLFILRQWAEGKFYNEVDEGWVPDTAVDPFRPYARLLGTSGRDLDRGVLMSMLGGAFFPGAEVCWVIRNPSIYKEPYRLKADPDFYAFSQTAANQNANQIPEQAYLSNTDVELSTGNDFTRGLQPGDLTKYSAVPWQADFNECTIQSIDITYEMWNQIDPASDNDPWMKQEQKTWDAMWWPAHRPLQTFEAVSVADGKPNLQFLGWSRGVPQTLAGDLKMVTEWARLGFVVRNPYAKKGSLDVASPDQKYISVERGGES